MPASDSSHTSCQGSCSKEETPPTLQEWDDAIVKLNPGRSHPSRDVLMNFLATSPEGQLMKSNVMGMGNVEPSKSRLKMYFTSRHTSFQSVREVMTMGGLQDVSEFSLQGRLSFLATTPRMPRFPSSLPAATHGLTLTHYARVSSTSSILFPRVASPRSSST